MLKLIPLTGAILVLSCTHVFAADSTITVSGNVRDNACTVATETKTFTVNLLDNTAKRFSVVGATSPLVPFRIVLSTCGSSVKAVKVGFTGTQDNENSQLLKIDDGASSASGMAVQILDSQQAALPVNATSPSLSWIPLSEKQTNILNFYARLMATRVPVTAGHVYATATFTLEFQ